MSRHGALETIERLLENVGARDIEVVRGSSRHTEASGRHEHFRKRQTTLLATGKHAYALVDGVIGKQERTEKAPEPGS